MRSVPDQWVKTLSDKAAIEAGCYFDPSYANRFLDFCSQFLRLSMDQWEGKPIEWMPFQLNEIILPLLNWRRSDGSPRFQQASIWLPKNSGKSQWSAAYAIYNLVCGPSSGNIVVSANTIGEADTVFRYIWDLVLRHPDLDKAIWVRDNIKTMELDRSILKVVSGDKKGKEGKPISLCIADELGWADSREVFESLRYNCGKRKSGQCINISTAGPRRESIGFEELTRAQRILNSELVDWSVLPVVHAAPANADWKKIETAKACNPAWGITVFPDVVEAELRAATQEPRKQQAYRTRRLNQFCGVATGWIPPDKWAACGAEIDEELLHGLDCFVGFDPAFKGDTAVYTLCIPHAGLLYLVPRFFAPRRTAEHKQATDKVPYLLWSETPAYHFYLTEGEVIDPNAIREKMLEDSQNFNFLEVAYDPTRGYDEFRQICERDYGWSMVSVPQRPKYLSPAAAWFERAVVSGTCRHSNSAPFNWHLENVCIKETADGMFPYKASETQRIDAVSASLMGISRFLVHDAEPSIYENRGL